MPWLSIIMWVISFLAAGGTKSGNAGKAALVATGVAAATYYAVDPANPNAAYDVFRTDRATTAVPSTTPTVNVGGDASGGGIFDTAVRTGGDVLKSWGPAGTVGVIAGTAAVTGSGSFSKLPSWVLPVGALALGFFLLK